MSILSELVGTFPRDAMQQKQVAKEEEIRQLTQEEEIVL
jgi:hypothetical protein